MKIQKDFLNYTSDVNIRAGFVGKFLALKNRGGEH